MATYSWVRKHGREDALKCGFLQATLNPFDAFARGLPMLLNRWFLRKSICRAVLRACSAPCSHRDPRAQGCLFVPRRNPAAKFAACTRLAAPQGAGCASQHRPHLNMSWLDELCPSRLTSSWRQSCTTMPPSSSPSSLQPHPIHGLSCHDSNERSRLRQTKVLTENGRRRYQQSYGRGARPDDELARLPAGPSTSERAGAQAGAAQVRLLTPVWPAHGQMRPQTPPSSAALCCPAPAAVAAAVPRCATRPARTACPSAAPRPEGRPGRTAARKCARWREVRRARNEGLRTNTAAAHRSATATRTDTAWGERAEREENPSQVSQKHTRQDRCWQRAVQQ